MHLAVNREYVTAGAAYTVTISDNTDPELLRAMRILDAAVLQIRDKAPLFDGPAPTNTNPSDIKNYQ